MNFSINLDQLKKNISKKENIFFFAIIGLIFSCDRISKLKIINNLSERVYFINDYINFDLIWNIGIGFGFLSSNSSIFYNSITFLIGIVIVYLMGVFIVSKNSDKLIYSIIIGGAIGNFYDRLIYKAVPDFIDLHYNNFHWFTFNVADIFISIGIILFIIKTYFAKDLK